MTTRRGAFAARLRAHPVLFGTGGAILLGGAVFVLVWFQPQALLFDRVVDEDFPTGVDEAASRAPPEHPAPPDEVVEPDPPAVDPGAVGDADDTGVDGADSADMGDADGDGDEEPTAPDDGPELATGPVALAAGSFSSRNRYTVEGTATVYELEDGTRVLRLEDFESTNGPDLFVYLTAADEADGDADLAADHVDLGVLRGNVGSQNYDIPDDVDLDRYDTAVIWCRRFTAGFGAADLSPPA